MPSACSARAVNARCENDSCLVSIQQSASNHSVRHALEDPGDPVLCPTGFAGVYTAHKGGNVLMKPCKADVVRIGLFLLFLLATVPAYCQRGTLGIDVGQISDRFAAYPSDTAGLVDINGEVTVKQPSAKNGGPSIVVGGEVRVPSDTNNHAKEYAVYGGLAFAAHNFSIGVDAQVRKIDMPVANINGEIFNRDNLELFQLPLVVKYKFGPGRHVFFEARGEPEFKPRYRSTSSTQVALPNPGFDHAYTLRGSVGYKFGQWYYIRGSYETRYFKFAETSGNPNNLYNWKSNVISGGVGLTF